MTSPSGARTVISSGYVALDVVKTAEGTWLRAGGTAANVAANLAFLGWSAALLGVIGADDAGRVAVDDLRSAGVDTTGLRLRPEAGTPLVMHRVDTAGHRYSFGCAQCGRPYVRHRPVSTEDVSTLVAAIGLAAVFFFDRVSRAALDLAESHARSGRLVVYEPSTGGRPSLHRAAAEVAHIVKFSRDRAIGVGAPLPASAGLLQIVTSGEDGLDFRVRGGSWHHQPAFPTHLVDAAGAGDWLSAMLIHVLPVSPDSWTLETVSDALATAQAAASVSCALPGARSLAHSVNREDLAGEIRMLREGRSPNPLSLPSLAETANGRLCDSCLLPLGL